MSPAPAAPLPSDLDAAIAAFASHTKVLVASDFDGVLAPLVDDPMTSRPLPGDMEALRAIAAAAGTTVALVSGRDLDTLVQLSGLAPDDAIVAIGSHGAQSTRATAFALSADEQAALDEVERITSEHVAAFPGTRLERKPAARVVHTRGMDPHEAQASASALVDALAGNPRFHVMEGKDVVEVSVVDATKGAALLGLKDSTGSAAVLYLGDDVTDETVFERLGPDDIGIKVGGGNTAATHRVDDPQTVLRVLQALQAALVER